MCFLLRIQQYPVNTTYNIQVVQPFEYRTLKCPVFRWMRYSGVRYSNGYRLYIYLIFWERLNESSCSFDRFVKSVDVGQFLQKIDNSDGNVGVFVRQQTQQWRNRLKLDKNWKGLNRFSLGKLLINNFFFGPAPCIIFLDGLPNEQLLIVHRQIS